MHVSDHALTGADLWAAVDGHFADTLLPHDPALEETLKSEDEEGLPAINVSAPQGMLLHLLTKTVRARAVLELGTLAGYSTIWMARALEPGGRVVTLELDPHHAEVAGRNLEAAGVAGVVDLRVGSALDLLEKIADEGLSPFDLVFIDANKESYPEYVRWALRLTRPGSLIVVDNVVRGGRVIDAAEESPLIRGIREALDILGTSPGVIATAIQTVGTKGYDGFAVALVTG